MGLLVVAVVQPPAVLAHQPDLAILLGTECGDWLVVIMDRAPQIGESLFEGCKLFF